MESKKTEKSHDKVNLKAPPVRDVPDGGRGWVIVFGFWLMLLFIAGLTASFGVTYVELRKKFNSSAAMTALCGGICSGFQALFGPFATVLSNRFSVRTTVFSGALMFGVSVILSGFSPNIYVFLTTYSIFAGIGGAMMYVPASVLVNQYFDRYRGIANGITNSGCGVGLFIFPAFMEVLFSHYGFYGAFMILGAIMLHNCAIALTFKPPDTHLNLRLENINVHRELEELKSPTLVGSSENVVTYSTWHLGSIQSADDAMIVDNNLSSNLSELDNKMYAPDPWWRAMGIHHMMNIHFVIFSTSLALQSSAYISHLQLIVDYGRDLHLWETEIAFLLPLSGLSDMIGRIASGIIFDIAAIKRFRTFFVCLYPCIAGLGILVAVFYQTYVGLALSSVVMGLFSGASFSLRAAVLVDLFGVEDLSSCFGILMTWMGISILLGPVASGKLKDVTDEYKWPFVFNALCYIVGGLMLFVICIWRTRRKSS